MSPEQAIHLIHAALEKVQSAGFVCNGEVCFCSPRTPGLVAGAVTAYVGPMNRLVIKTVPLAAKVALPTPKPYEKTATGDVCSRCGSANLRWAGACRVCAECGESQGCS